MTEQGGTGPGNVAFPAAARAKGPARSAASTGFTLDRRRYLRFFRAFLFLSVAASALAFVLGSVHWPLLGDSAQIHYICFLMDHGMPPYRVAQDMNMPGALGLEWLVIHTLGGGSLAWRCFDLTLLAAGTGAMAVIAGRGHRLAGVGAGLLLLLLHGVDGLNDTGERDLSMAVFLLLCYGSLFALLRCCSGGKDRPDARSGALALACGFFAGTAASIKPTVLPLVLVLLAVLAFRRVRRAAWLSLSVAAVGFLLPLAAVLALLLRQHALIAFLHGLRTSVPYYASLQHRGLGYLLLHSVSPLLVVVVCWAACWLLRAAWARQRSGRGVAAGTLEKLERRLLLLGVAFGLLSYVVQGKGFPYYRYPLLALLLPLMAVDFDAALARATVTTRKRDGLRVGLAALALLYAAAWLAPLSAWKAGHFRWQDQQLIGSLTGDLTALHAANGQVQCIDSIGGCGNTLLRLRLVQSTGLLSDFFVFGSPQAVSVREARARFQAAVAAGGLPRYVVATDRLHLHPEDPGRWAKLERWPWFSGWLGAKYTLVLTREPTRMARWWSRPEWPGAYRIYVRNDQAARARAMLVSAASATSVPPGWAGPLTLPEP